MKKTLIFASIVAATSAMASPFGSHQEIGEQKSERRALRNNEVKIGKYILSTQEIERMSAQGYIFDAYSGKWVKGKNTSSNNTINMSNNTSVTSNYGTHVQSNTKTENKTKESVSPFGHGQITMGGRKKEKEQQIPDTAPTVAEKPAYALESKVPNNYPTVKDKPAYNVETSVPNNYPTTENKPAYPVDNLSSKHDGNSSNNEKFIPSNYPTVTEKPAHPLNSSVPNNYPTTEGKSAYNIETRIPNNYPTTENKPYYLGKEDINKPIPNMDTNNGKKPIGGVDLSIKNPAEISSVVIIDGKENKALDNTPDNTPDNFTDKQTSNRMGWDYRTQTTRPIRPDMGEFFVGNAIKNQSDLEEMKKHGFSYDPKTERWYSISPNVVSSPRKDRYFTDEEVLDWILEKRKNKESVTSVEQGYDRHTDKLRPVNYNAGEVLVGKNIKTKEDLAEMRRYGFGYDAKQRKWVSLSENVTTPTGSRYFSDSEAYDYFVNRKDKKDEGGQWGVASDSKWNLSDGERAPQHLTIKPKEDQITAEIKDSGASLMAAVLGKHYSDKYGKPNNRGEKWIQENSVPLSGTEQLSCKSIMCLVAGAFGHGECKGVLKHYFSIKKIHKRIRFLKICPLRDKNKVMERVKQKDLYEMGYQGKSAEQATKVHDSFISNVATKMETSCDANGLNNRIEVYRHKVDRNEYITYKRVTRHMTGYCKGLKEHYSQVILPYYNTELCGKGENWYLDTDFDRGYYIRDQQRVDIPKTCWVDDEKAKIAQDKHIKEMSKKIMEEGLKNKLTSEQIHNRLFNLTTSEKFQIKN